MKNIIRKIKRKIYEFLRNFRRSNSTNIKQEDILRFCSHIDPQTKSSTLVKDPSTGIYKCAQCGAKFTVMG